MTAKTPRNIAPVPFHTARSAAEKYDVGYHALRQALYRSGALYALLGGIKVYMEEDLLPVLTRMKKGKKWQA